MKEKNFFSASGNIVVMETVKVFMMTRQTASIKGATCHFSLQTVFGQLFCSLIEKQIFVLHSKHSNSELHIRDKKVVKLI